MNVLHAARVWKKNQQLVEEYTPRRQFGGTVHIFQTDENAAEHVLDRVLRPERVRRHTYQLVPVGGLSAHSAMMEPPNLAQFVDDVATVISAAQAAVHRSGSSTFLPR